MSIVTIMLVNENHLSDFYFKEDKEDKEATARELVANGEYHYGGDFFFDQEGESAAEEAFDLTNNPSRQAEREKIYGKRRSVSVGDIVKVDDVYYLCASFGWKAIDITPSESLSWATL